MISGTYEEVVIGGGPHYITYSSAPDPQAFELMCPRCHAKNASRLVFTIEEVLKGENREDVELTDEFRAKAERALRRYLVEHGDMVNQVLTCLCLVASKQEIGRLERW